MENGLLELGSANKLQTTKEAATIHLRLSADWQPKSSTLIYSQAYKFPSGYLALV
jgi:hypothetical protein